MALMTPAVGFAQAARALVAQRLVESEKLGWVPTAVAAPCAPWLPGMRLTRQACSLPSLPWHLSTAFAGDSSSGSDSSPSPSPSPSPDANADAPADQGPQRELPPLPAL